MFLYYQGCAILRLRDPVCTGLDEALTPYIVPYGTARLTVTYPCLLRF